MPLVPCRMCKKVYNSLSSDKRVCPNCRRKLDELYTEVREYLRDNIGKKFNVETLADAVGADVGDIQVLVDLGYLERDILGSAGDAEAASRQKLAQEFADSLNKMREAAAAKKSVSYGQDLYGAAATAKKR